MREMAFTSGPARRGVVGQEGGGGVRKRGGGGRRVKGREGERGEGRGGEREGEGRGGGATSPPSPARPGKGEVIKKFI